MLCLLARSELRRDARRQPYTLLSSVISHQGGVHLLVNTFGTCCVPSSRVEPRACARAVRLNMGPAVLKVLGDEHFAAFYVLAGASPLSRSL